MQIRLHIKDQKEMQKLAGPLGALLRPGDCILFMGDLGAGKTHLIREIANALEIDKRLVTSPTFSIVHIYEGGKLPLLHADLYRLGEYPDLEETGLAEALAEGSYCTMIEWGEYLQKEYLEGLHVLGLRLHFPEEVGDGAEGRIIEITCTEGTWQERVKRLVELLKREGIEIEGAGP